MTRLLGFCPTARLVGDERSAYVIASVAADADEGLTITLEHDDGSLVTVVIPAEHVDWSVLAREAAA